MNPKRFTARHIIIKMPKVKDRENLKSGKENQVFHTRGLPSDWQVVIQQKLLNRPEESGMKYSKGRKAKPYRDGLHSKAIN